MPYTQNWGISRSQSPLNNNEEDKDIIKQNNQEAAMQAASISGGGSFLTKQVLKEGVKKYVAPAIGKALGVMGMFLTSQSAQGGQNPTPEFLEWNEDWKKE